MVHLARDGRRSKTTLGDCTAIPLVRARELARDFIDAGAGETSVPALPACTLVAAFAERFLADCAGRWKASTLRTNRDCVERHVLPAFGTRRVAEVERADVLTWLHDAAAPSGARARALPVLSGLMQHAELLGLRPPGSNPCKGLRRRKTAFSATYLDAAGYAALGAALRALEADHHMEVAALRFLALTGARKGEALALEWHIIDGARAVLPDAKAGPRTIWLGPPGRRLLAPCPGSAVTCSDWVARWTSPCPLIGSLASGTRPGAAWG